MANNKTIPIKKNIPVMQVFSYEVIMTVHIISDNEKDAKATLDEKGGIVTKREVELLNFVPLYEKGETE